MRGAEALSHLIELVRQIANLVISFNGYLVREVTAAELDHPFTQPDDRLGKALAQDTGNTHAEEQTDARDCESEPQRLGNGSIEDGLGLLNYHSPGSHREVQTSCQHPHSIFVGILPLDERQVWRARALHEALDQ